MAMRHHVRRAAGPLAALAFLLLGLVAALVPPPPARALTGTKPCVVRPGPVPPRRSLPLTWRAGSSSNGCFFFSGPFELGRDTHLGGSATMTVSGQATTLDFGRGVVFRGTLSGDRLSLTRRATYEYGGPWETTETITGTYSGNFLRASYGYQECDTANRGGCPGVCRIRAAVTACLPP